MRAVWCRIAPCKPLAWVPRLNLKHRALAGAVPAHTVLCRTNSAFAALQMTHDLNFDAETYGKPGLAITAR
jgi:hypothetical protein